MGGWAMLGEVARRAAWRFGRRRRLAMTALVLLAACGDVGTVPPATVVSSTNWGALQPTYNGTARAWGKGTFENRGNSVALVDGDYKDPAADGNAAYVNVQFLSKGPRGGIECSGWGSSFTCSNGTSTGWNQMSSQSTPEIGTADGQKKIRTSGQANLYQQLIASDEAARGAVYVCSQFGFPVPDPCALATPSFAY